MITTERLDELTRLADAALSGWMLHQEIPVRAAVHELLAEVRRLRAELTEASNEADDIPAPHDGAATIAGAIRAMRDMRDEQHRRQIKYW